MTVGAGHEPPLAEAVRAVLDRAAEVTAGGPDAATVAALAARLDGPLRIAIAGRVKAGKSTLLNALVGERLAPTDAGECTRLVTWYQQGPGYEVAATLPDGTTRPLRFDRGQGALEVDVDGLAVADIDHLVVRWPSERLRRSWLVDTPGLGSTDEATSARTRDLLASSSDGPADVDAVIYLLRHLHATDAAFLDAMVRHRVLGATASNAVAVLSRADEIGAARLDAMTSAARIAERYQRDPHLHRLVAAVVPVAGLCAETGCTLTEHEAADLARLAATEPAVLDRMLLSVDELRDPTASDLTVAARSALLDRLGLFGVRTVVDALRRGTPPTATALSALLVEVSGIPALQRVIAERFLPRATVLQARSVLGGLRAVARRLGGPGADGAAVGAARALEGAVEQLEQGHPEFSRLRLLDLLAVGAVRADDAGLAELDRLLRATSVAGRVGLDDDAPVGAMRDATVGGSERWRARAGSPGAAPEDVATYELVARTYEQLFLALAG